MKTISPKQAAAMLREGAVMVDIRGADERAREQIPGTSHQPLDSLQPGSCGAGAPAVIFHCKSGMRTLSNAARLDDAAACDAYILEGGLDAWKAAGLPCRKDSGQPLDMMRQVQIAAGSLVVAGVLLGALVAPGFYILSGFVGAGLVFAGLTGTCGMARLLSLMPWNRRNGISGGSCQLPGA